MNKKPESTLASLDQLKKKLQMLYNPPTGHYSLERIQNIADTLKEINSIYDQGEYPTNKKKFLNDVTIL